VEDRRQGFQGAFASSSISLNPAYICDNLPLHNPMDTIVQHLSDYPEISAVFTSEFEIAMLVKKALSGLHRRHPSFALVTFDHPGYEIDCMRRVHTPPLCGVLKGMYPETNTLPEQHTRGSAAGYVDFPGLLCLRQNEESIGRQAVEILYRIIQGESGQFLSDILVPAEMAAGEVTSI
jgi:DNA-binding LacI/PurR family transcriptional regulator